jgi:hypothetical protein
MNAPRFPPCQGFSLPYSRARAVLSGLTVSARAASRHPERVRVGGVMDG